LSSTPAATFRPDELAVALSHYDLGVIESITPFTKGSGQSPKVGVVCEKGKFLFKRRATRRADPDRVRSAHAVQRRLIDTGFPVPRLMPTRGDGRTFLQLRDGVYELFEFAAGQPYHRTPDEARDAGATLARFHQALADLATDWRSISGDYHDAAGVRTGLCRIGSTLSAHDSFTGEEAQLAPLVQFFLERYDAAAREAESAGIVQLEPAIVHADWHPGNMMFRDGRVIAVIDYDSVRQSRRVSDIANGTMQFAMTGSGDPSSWPDHLDEARMIEFLVGYESVDPLAEIEHRCIAPLMAESLIAECVPSIAESGIMGRWCGFRVLKAIRRRLEWLGADGRRCIAIHWALGD
jgi:Ser/Thr protein kinase RdoA (MazF antagonist)